MSLIFLGFSYSLVTLTDFLDFLERPLTGIKGSDVSSNVQLMALSNNPKLLTKGRLSRTPSPM